MEHTDTLLKPNAGLPDRLTYAGIARTEGQRASNRRAPTKLPNIPDGRFRIDHALVQTCYMTGCYLSLSYTSNI